MLQRVIVITLVLSSHISLCAGSLFSVGMAFASQIATDEQSALMTPDTRAPLCMLMTPHPDTQSPPDTSPCGEGKKCSGSPLALLLAPPQSGSHNAALTTSPFALHHLDGSMNPQHEVQRNRKPPGKTAGLLIATVVRRE